MNDVEREIVIKNVAEHADDFVFLMIFEKSADPEGSRVVGWLSGHAIELSLKAACLHYRLPKIAGSDHNLTPLFYKLDRIKQQGNVWPTNAHFAAYKRLFIRAGEANAHLPPPAELDWIELGFWISNIGNLKYGFDKDWKNVSTLEIRYSEVNSRFLSLFRQLRSNYATPTLDARLKQKFMRIYRTPGEETKLNALLGL